MKRMKKAVENSAKWFDGETFTNGYTDKEFNSIASKFLCADVLDHGVLSDSQKALITLASLTASGTYGVIENILLRRSEQVLRQMR